MTPRAPMGETAKEIILFADPMCSWCWGFSPVIGAIGETYAARAPVSLVLGGLRPGTTEAMDDAAKQTVRHHWEQVGETTGQPFSFAFFDGHGFVYDTEPACRAAVAVRSLEAAKALGYVDALHRAFYVDNRDLTDSGVLADVAQAAGIEDAAFRRAFASDEVRQATDADFRYSRQLGISGFPTVVLKDERGMGALTVGYRPLEALLPHLEKWIAE